MKNALVLAAVLAFITCALAATWLADWRWLVTGAGAFLGLCVASGVAPGRTKS